MEYDYIVVGAGFAGAIVANRLAANGSRVLVIEKRNHVAGNMYDYVDKCGIIVHKYGPHILMLNRSEVFNFLSKYTDWVYPKTILETYIDSKFIPLPINLNSVNLMYEKEKAEKISEELISSFGLENTINVLDLLNSDSEILKSFANDVYEKVFVGYNRKMWDLSPTEIDKEVVGRSPIKISYNNEKSNQLYEVVPKNGYTELFNNLLNHENITLQLNTDAFEKISIKDNCILYDNKLFRGKLVYTGPIDELFNYKHGVLPYRALYFKKEIKPTDSYYNSTAVTFPLNYKKTRSSEMKKITLQEIEGTTIIVSEYPGEYDKTSNKFQNPSYPVLNETSSKMKSLYLKEASKIKQLYLVGRLAEFQYYNMEDTIVSALELVKKIGGKS